jgi:hypothetical protein
MLDNAVIDFKRTLWKEKFSMKFTVIVWNSLGQGASQIAEVSIKTY